MTHVAEMFEFVCVCVSSLCPVYFICQSHEASFHYLTVEAIRQLSCKKFGFIPVVAESGLCI